MVVKRKHPKKSVPVFERDKLGRFVKAPLPLRKKQLPSKAPLPLRKKPLPAKASLPRRKKQLPAKAPLPLRKKPLPAKAPLPLRKKPLPAKAPLPRRKKQLPAKAPLPRRKKQLPAKAPLPLRKKPLPSKAPLPRRKKPLPEKAPLPLRKKKRPAKAPLPRRKKQRPAKAPLPLHKKKPKKKPKKKAKRRYPSFMAVASQAETMIQDKLVVLGDLMKLTEADLNATVKSFINADSTVDGELRISNLPDEWRQIAGLPSIVATISEAVRGAGAFPAKPLIGGAFWVSFGLRFGPKDLDEIMLMAKEYKRFRGLLQVGAHHTTAQSLPAMLNNALALRMFIDRIWAKRSLPPVQLLVRFVWTPKKVNPGRFSGEEGSSK